MFANYVYFEQQYLSVMNVSSEPLRGAVFGTENTKVHVPQLDILPFQRQLFWSTETTT